MQTWHVFSLQSKWCKSSTFLILTMAEVTLTAVIMTFDCSNPILTTPVFLTAVLGPVFLPGIFLRLYFSAVSGVGGPDPWGIPSRLPSVPPGKSGSGPFQDFRTNPMEKYIFQFDYRRSGIF